MKKFIILILSAFFLFSCDDSTNIDDINIFTLQDDVNLGINLDSQIVANSQEYPILNNQQAQQYLNQILTGILLSPEIEHKNVSNYKIRIINRDDVINAFAIPGGIIYVYTGLLKFIDNEATLAGIIAHEVAHIERRHASKRMTMQYGISFLLELILGENPSQWEEIGANLLTGLALLKNSREDEYEADEYSFKYLKTSIWYPGAILFFFDKIKSNQSEGYLDELLSTHPMPEDRITAVKNLLEENNIPEPTENNLFTNRYHEFLKILP